MKNQLYSLVFFLLVFASAMAQSNQEVVRPGDVVVEGRITDALIKLELNQKFKVTLSISSFPANITTAPLVRYVQEVDTNNYFRFIIPSPANRFYVHISFAPYGDTFIDNIYILENGDRINCFLSKGDVKFLGRGSAKLNCQNAIYRIKYKATKADLKFANSNQWPEAIQLNSLKLDSVLQLRLDVVSRFAPILGKEMTNILKANCYGLRYFASLRGERVVSGIPGRFTAFINSPTYGNINSDLDKSLDTNAMIASPNYADFLFERILVENLKRTEGKPDHSEENLKWIFSKIKSDYKGLLREKLLTIYFLHYKNIAHTLIFLEEALDMVEKEEYKMILADVKGTKFKGIAFYPFEMENDKGNMVNLIDFKGKVVLIDFWFTGCIPCKLLNSLMKPVIAQFMYNPNVKFVSVNIDTDKSRWLKSVSSEEYTHPATINLYAGVKKASTKNIHPLIKAYNITNYPTLVLLKDGKIYQFDVSRPLASDQNNPQKGNTKKMIDLINRALIVE